MAMTSTITQSQSAQMGSPTTFVVAVINGGGGQVKIQSMQPTVKKPDGTLYTACTIGPLIATAQLGVAVVGGSQFNVPVAGSATVYFSFQVVFFGPAILGGPTQPSQTYLVDCINSYDDNTTSGCLSPILGNLNQPSGGVVGGGSPPNPTVLIGQLNYSSPLNSGLAL